MKKKVVVKVKGYDIVVAALEYAAARACNRCDYNEVALTLTESQRSTLTKEFEQSFWLAMDDAGAEII